MAGYLTRERNESCGCLTTEGFMDGIGYGRFLGLFHRELPEPAILELDE